MSGIEMLLKDAEGGLVCLVPLAGKLGITCHEYTVCDCEVLEIIAACRELVRGLESIYGHATVLEPHIKLYASEALARAAAILEGK